MITVRAKPVRMVLIALKRAIHRTDAITAQPDSAQTSWLAWTAARRPG
jgi:hypothetical protein